MPQVPAETIQTPAHDTLYAMTTHVGDELVEGGPAVLRSTDALIDVLDRIPAARCNIPSQFDQLVLGRLFVRTHARIERDLHLVLLAERLPPLLLAVFGFATETRFFSSHARSARSTCIENGIPSRSLTRRRPSMISGS